MSAGEIWRDKEFRALPRRAQCLFLQLREQPMLNNAGVLPLMISKWAKGCDELTSDEVMQDLAVLIDRGFVVVDLETEELLICAHIRRNKSLKHKYLFENALTCALAVESETLRKMLAAELRHTRRSAARTAIEILDPPEPQMNPIPGASETGSNDEVNPSESHSDPIATASESDTGDEGAAS